MRILIVKTSALGDIVHAFSVLESMKHHDITWVVEEPFRELVDAHPYVDHTLTISTKRWRKNLFERRNEVIAFVRELQKETYDIVYDLQGNTKSGLITFFARGDQKVGFGRKTVPEWPNLLFTNVKINPPPGLNIREDYLHLTDSKMPRGGIVLESDFPLPKIPEGCIMVCPGSNWPNKQLSVDTLVEFLKRYDAPFVLTWGTDEEKQLANEIEKEIDATVLDRLPIPALQNLMKQVKLVVAMDSLPLHLAALAGTPTFSFFGPSNAKKYAPVGEQHTHYQGSCPYGKQFKKRCPVLRTCKTGACMKKISIKNIR